MGIFSGVLNLVGGALGARSQESAGNKNADLQREFAKHGIRWKVADAKAAGLHPLAALGSQGISASPAYVGGGDYGVSSMGQDIESSINAMKTPEEKGDRLGAFIEQKVAAQNARDMAQRHEAREDLRLQSQLANDEVQRQYWTYQMTKDSRAQQPGMPSSGTGPIAGQKFGAIQYEPDKVTSSDASGTSTAGVHPGGVRVKLPGLGPVNVMGDKASQGTEEMDLLRYIELVLANPGLADRTVNALVDRAAQSPFIRPGSIVDQIANRYQNWRRDNARRLYGR